MIHPRSAERETLMERRTISAHISPRSERNSSAAEALAARPCGLTHRFSTCNVTIRGVVGAVRHVTPPSFGPRSPSIASPPHRSHRLQSPSLHPPRSHSLRRSSLHRTPHAAHIPIAAAAAVLSPPPNSWHIVARGCSWSCALRPPPRAAVAARCAAPRSWSCALRPPPRCPAARRRIRLRPMASASAARRRRAVGRRASPSARSRRALRLRASPAPR